MLDWFYIWASYQAKYYKKRSITTTKKNPIQLMNFLHNVFPRKRRNHRPWWCNYRVSMMWGRRRGDFTTSQNNNSLKGSKVRYDNYLQIVQLWVKAIFTSVNAILPQMGSSMSSWLIDTVPYFIKTLKDIPSFENVNIMQSKVSHNDIAISN